MSSIGNAILYARKNEKLFLSELIEFLRIPSISTNPESSFDIQRAAEWIAKKLKHVGIDNVKIIPTEGHPIVTGEYLKAGAEKPTVLLYGHYDVQPVEPLDLWNSGPFEPLESGDFLYARGSSDMKGQIIASIGSIEAIMKTDDFPVNLKFLIEGEEEIGSPSLLKFLQEQKGLLSSTFALNPDTGMIAPNIPTIVYGLRGLAYFEIRVYGPEHDLHSGVFGGVIHNPANALAQIIAGMHDQEGKVALPGFYDDVFEISQEEKSELARLPMDDQYYLHQTNSPAVFGEKGFSSTERVGVRPTLDVNGLLSGFTGKGSKTIIPAWAMAKISMRLVPNQDPAKVYDSLVEYMRIRAPKTIRWEIIKLGAGPACTTDPKFPATQALAKALESVWGVKPVYKREGGSVPVVAEMQQVLGLQSVLTGFGLPDDNIHSPNERMHIPTWKKGIEALIHFFYNL